MIKRRMEFSKKIFIGVSIIAVSVIVFSMYMVYKTNDLSPLTYLISAVGVEVGAATGFYYWKAKNENIIKLGGKPNDLEH